ncbi:MAG: hypothetical protein GF418_09625, partial [Chitinivibrionales bacterium]|nr:hypothetical protein [Chitinivibrionales bacterium]MBD3395869.1 hypothetical protein [Chitinivibrionales bacterium]
MSSANFSGKPRESLFSSLFRISLAALTLWWTPGIAAEVCELVFTGCPEDFSGDTIIVPENIIALSAEIPACPPPDISEGTIVDTTDTGGPPSIVFVIDHSGSMTGTGNGNNDPLGARFTVVLDLLDTISTTHPDAEVGIVVFREHLYFDTASNDYFADYFKALPVVRDGEPRQAYVQLLQLNQNYKGRTGKEVIEDILTVRADSVRQGDPDTLHRYVDLEYEPGFNNVQSTNINVALEAAKLALQEAQYPKEKRFVIFFSDGYPVPDNIDHAGKEPYDFVNGTSMPTTFTVFFNATPEDSSVFKLARVVEMTENIRNNGYSSSNPNSEVWTLQASHDALFDLLREEVLGILISPQTIVSTGVPTKMVINSESYKSQTGNSFVFSQRFGLNADLTAFSMNIDYRYTNQVTQQTRDTSVTVTFHVKREAGASLPSGISAVCWTQPTIDLLHEGTSVVGGTVNETMDQLEVQLNVRDETVSSGNVTVSSSLEDEDLNLSQSGSIWTKTFPRFVAENAEDNDGRLQHDSPDSIVVVWRNPNLPLDTVRIAVPFSVSRTLSLSAAYYFDRNADGFIDSIQVNMNVDLTAADLGAIEDFVKLPSSRSFGSDVRYVSAGGGFAILVSETGDEPRTGVDAQDKLRLTSGVMDHGGLVNASEKQIQDRMAPVIVEAIVVLGDSLGDTLKVRFSEPVATITHTRPFLFRSVTDSLYAGTIKEPDQNGTAFSSLVTFSGISDVRKGDS